MKLVVISDLHLDARTAGRARLPELLDFLERARAVARDEDADLMVCLGDLFDPGRDDLRLASVLVAEASKCSRAVRFGSVWIAGNHDVVHGSEWVTTLSPLVAATAFEERRRTWVFEKPGVVRFEGESGHVALLALPWPPAPCEALWRQMVAVELDGLRGAEADVVVCAHLCVPGAALDSESKELARGRDVVLPVRDLVELDPDVVLNGHYHRPQTVDVNGLEVVIPGSALHLAFDDTQDAGRGVVVVEL